MEGIKSLSQSLFNNEQQFRDPPVGYKFDTAELNIIPNDPSDPSDPSSERVKLSSLREDDLCAWLPSTASLNVRGCKTEARLRIVCILRHLDVSLCISRSGFTRIFDSMKADPSVKYMICRDYDGFHEFHGDGFRLTRFLGNSWYALVWTFDPDTVTTTALFLDRRRRHVFARFTDVLHEFRSLACTPSLLSFVSCYFLLQFCDLDTGGWEIGTVRNVEQRTGFGPHPMGYRGLEPLSLLKNFDINQLTSWLQAVNEVAGNAGNRIRHMNTCLSVLKIICDEHRRGEQHGISGQALDRCQDCLATIIKAIPAVERHMLAYVDYLSFLKERSERLSTVVRPLLTHEDAHASIDLAAASRRDGSSMKTIAVMTMVFLPATFYAALFAVPSLQWDHGSAIIQDNFWVYWAFTLPTTLVVFLVWLGITGRGWIREKALAVYKSHTT
ncbi:hypothetical protein QBC43DRAFT_323322 [Cladorrhinum sp. PSN259]|nr:hypothetical protein QBC43DRAFT_323322 [Cladorrhinum sp. PSN259]